MKRRLLCLLMSALLVMTAIIFRISRYYSYSCDVYANNGIKGSISQKIHSLLCDTLDSTPGVCSNAVNINYKENGCISAINVNTALINTFATETAVKIYDKINSGSHSFGVPISNALGLEYIAFDGPRIAVNIAPIGAVEYEIKSEIIESAINQTLHRVSIEFKTSISCLAPFHESKIDIISSIVIAETLIVGNVPEILLPAN